jgi:peptidyl-tRNA hydrolase
VEANNAAIEQLHTLDMSTVRGYATAAAEAAAQIRGAAGSCLVLFIRADLISDMTVKSAHPSQTKIVARAGEIEDVCYEIAADADRAAVEAGVAQSVAETVVGLINDLLVSTQNARRCPLEAVPADYVQGLETRAAQGAELVNRARTDANAAYKCLAGAGPVGGEPPALVRRSTVPKPGAAKPPQGETRSECLGRELIKRRECTGKCGFPAGSIFCEEKYRGNPPAKGCLCDDQCWEATRRERERCESLPLAPWERR